MQSFITAIGTAVPDHKISQPEAARWMVSSLGLSEREAKVLHSLYEASGISCRYSVLPDFIKPKSDFTFFPKTDNLEPFPTVGDRMNIYKNEALPLSLKAIDDCLDQRPDVKAGDISHLIVVSCTGMYAPGLDIELIEKLGLRKNVERICVQFMGCYAAFNAMKIGDYICKSDPSAKVLVICVELCSIHFQKTRDRDKMVSNALFGDGAAALLIEANSPKGISLSPESFACELAPNSHSDMAWHIADHGFEMTLSSYVPQVIKGGIATLAGKLIDRLNLTKDDISFYAIHPGGRRILEVCEEELGMSRNDNECAYHVLSDYGNMSSPTVLFVMKEHWKKMTRNDENKKILSFAFGPGLTMESALLKVYYA
jgi:predicted naringenin-chalcone synthase